MEQSRFYGRYARLVIAVARRYARKYRCPDIRDEGPAVYVSRHLDIHGPIESVVNLPLDVHPLSLHVFLNWKTCAAHLRAYTFTERVGKEAGFWQRMWAFIAGVAIAPLMRSLQAVPVYRESGEALKTIRQGVKYLEKGESLMVWPDVEYTGDYGEDFEIYTGFLLLGEIYRKRTGKELPFIPLVLDDENGIMIKGNPVFCNDFKQDAARAAREICWAIDKRNAQTPVNSVQANL